DGRMVPRPSPRTAAGVARRRPRRAQGRRAPLRSRCARARPPPRPVPEPVRAPPSHRDARLVNIRKATAADEAVLHELVDEFSAEAPAPAAVGPGGWDDEWASISRSFDGGAVSLAEDDDGAAGMAYALPPDRGRSHLQLVHVRPRARRRGVATALVLACVEEVKGHGARRISLDVLHTNPAARAVWQRLGFEEVAHVM